MCTDSLRGGASISFGLCTSTKGCVDLLLPVGFGWRFVGYGETRKYHNRPVHHTHRNDTAILHGLHHLSICGTFSLCTAKQDGSSYFTHHALCLLSPTVHINFCLRTHTCVLLLFCCGTDLRGASKLKFGKNYAWHQDFGGHTQNTYDCSIIGMKNLEKHLLQKKNRLSTNFDAGILSFTR